MTAIWVLENINKDREYYSKFNILCLFSSVVVYKRNNPNHFTKLYVDDLTYSFIEDLGAIHLWDEVIKFEFDLNVDKSVFWASSKLHILSKVREPVIIIDNDSLVYENLDKYLDNKIIVSNLENGKGYYPLSFDPFIRKLSYKARWQPESVNVSFLYLPDSSFTREYANLSIQFMEEFTAMRVPDSQYLIFAEQLLLKHLIDKNNLPYQSLISTYWDCQDWEWGADHDKGIWKHPESNKHYFHYGPLKSYFKAKKYPDCNYSEEIKKFRNLIQIDIDESKFPRE